MLTYTLTEERSEPKQTYPYKLVEEPEEERDLDFGLELEQEPLREEYPETPDLSQIKKYAFFFDPNDPELPANKFVSRMKLAGKGLVAGAMDIGASVGAVLEYAGSRMSPRRPAGFRSALADIAPKFAGKLSEAEKRLGKETVDYWEKKAERFEPPVDIRGKNIVDDPEMLSNTSWWIYNVARIMPSFAAAYLPGAGASRSVQVAGQTLKWSKPLVERLARLAAGAGAGVVGGGLEASSTYREVLRQTGDEEQAARSAEAMFVISGFLNAVGMDKVLAKAGSGLKAKVTKTLGKGVWEGVTEGLEEPGQVVSELIGMYATGKELPRGPEMEKLLIESLKEGLTVAPIAAVTGLGGGVATEIPEISKRVSKDPIARAIALGQINEGQARQVSQEAMLSTEETNQSIINSFELKNILSESNPNVLRQVSKDNDIPVPESITRASDMMAIIADATDPEVGPGDITKTTQLIRNKEIMAGNKGIPEDKKAKLLGEGDLLKGTLGPMLDRYKRSFPEDSPVRQLLAREEKAAEVAKKAKERPPKPKLVVPKEKPAVAKREIKPTAFETYDEAQKAIDDFESKLISAGKKEELYTDPELQKLYDDRDAIGQKELEQSKSEITDAVKKVEKDGSLIDNVLRRVYSIDPTVDTGQYFAAKYAQDQVQNRKDSRKQIFNIVKEDYGRKHNLDMEGVFTDLSGFTKEGQRKLVKELTDRAAKIEEAVYGYFNRTEEVKPVAKPTAEFLDYQEQKTGPPVPLYNYTLPSGGKSTVTAETLKERGIEVPETPPYKPELEAPNIVSAAKKIDSAFETGALVSIKDLRAEFQDMPKAEFDKMVLDAAEKQDVWLHQHAHPSVAKTEEVVKEGEDVYMGVALRKKIPEVKLEEKQREGGEAGGGGRAGVRKPQGPEGETKLAARQPPTPTKSQITNSREIAKRLLGILHDVGADQSIINNTTLIFKPVIEMDKELRRKAKTSMEDYEKMGKKVQEILATTELQDLANVITFAQDTLGKYGPNAVEDTVIEEAYHLIRGRMLSKDVMGKLDKLYKGNEEAEAKDFVSYYKRGIGGVPKSPSWVVKQFYKLKAFLQRLGNFLRNRGFTRKQDIFGSIKVGAYGKVIQAPSKKVALATKAFHGSPHLWKPTKEHPYGRANLAKVGTGEGAQAFGWGLYFSDLEGIARYYDRAGQRGNYNVFLGKEKYETNIPNVKRLLYISKGNINDAIKEGERLADNAQHIYDSQEYYDAIDELIRLKKTGKKIKVNTGVTYKATLHPTKAKENWLDWHEPIRTEQLDVIIARIEEEKLSDKIMKVFGIGSKEEFLRQVRLGSFEGELPTGQSIYRGVLQSGLGSDKEASLFLRRAGIDGIRYPTETLSGKATKGRETFNYVVFDEDAISIDEVLDPSDPKVFLAAVTSKGTYEPSPGGLRLAAKPFKFDSADEAVYQQGKALPKTPLKESVSNKLTEFKNRASREFEHLPRTKEFAQLGQLVRRLQKQKPVVSERMLKEVGDITKGLNPAQYDLFVRKVVLDDLLETAALQLKSGEPVQLPLTKGLKSTDRIKKLKSYLNNINAAISSDTAVQDALQRREDAWDSIKTEYIDSMNSIGFNVSKKFDRKNYFRHQIREYVDNYGLYGTGAKLKTPRYRTFLKRRTGRGEGVISTRYVEVEHEVLAQMAYDVEVARTLKQIKDDYDMLPFFKRTAIRLNDQQIMKYFEEVAEQERLRDPASTVTGESLYRKTLNMKQAIGYDKLGRLAASNQLPVGDKGEWRWLVDEIADNWSVSKPVKKGEQRVPLSDKAARAYTKYITYLMKLDTPGSYKSAAATVVKGWREKADFIKEQLGPSYVTWEDLVKDNSEYSDWAPESGANVFFLADSIPANLANQLINGKLSEIKLNKDQIRKIMAVGGKRDPMVVKNEIALTLDNLTKTRQDPIIGRAWKDLLTAWKIWQLTSPRRWAKYNFRNLTGDADAVFAGNPKVFLKTPEAISELYDHYFKGNATPNLRGYLDRGGAGITLQAMEIGEFDQLKLFQHLAEKHAAKSLRDIPSKAWKNYWKIARLTTDFRESILRYAAYIYAQEDMMANPSQLPSSYWASIPDEIKGLKSVEDRAFLLSNELLGAYDRIGVYGQHLRNFWYPFWSWKEVNARRYFNLFRNAASDGNAMAGVARMLGGKALFKAPYYAVRVGSFLVGASALWAMMVAWNAAFPDDDREAVDDVTKRRPHILIPNVGKLLSGQGLTAKDDSGEIMYFSRLGALADLLEWVGLDVLPLRLNDFLTGRKNLKEIAKDMGTDAYQSVVNTWIQGGTPYIKTLAELVTKRSLYPDVFRMGTIRDRTLHIMRNLGMEPEYKAVMDAIGKDLPSEPYSKSLVELMVYRVDPLESAYRNILDRKRDFLRSVGQYSEGFWLTPKGNALYNLRASLRYGDMESAIRFRNIYLAMMKKEYDLLGKTFDANAHSNAMENIRRSIKAMHPLFGMTTGGGLNEEGAAFLNGLNPEDKARLIKAVVYWKELASGKKLED